MKREIEEYHFIGDNSGIGLLKGSEIILDEGLHRLHKTPLLALQLGEDHPEKEDSHMLASPPNMLSLKWIKRWDTGTSVHAMPVQRLLYLPDSLLLPLYMRLVPGTLYLVHRYVYYCLYRDFTSWQPSPAPSCSPSSQAAMLQPLREPAGTPDFKHQA